MMGPMFASAAYNDPVNSNEPVQAVDKPDNGSGGMSTGESRSDSRSKAEYVDDSAITDSVKKALDRDPQVANQDVKVDTKNGIVTLSGKVNDIRFKGRIVQIVQGVKGVRSVRNNIALGNS